VDGQLRRLDVEAADDAGGRDVDVARGAPDGAALRVGLVLRAVGDDQRDQQPRLAPEQQAEPADLGLSRSAALAHLASVVI
jgi:hypothetical protein